MGVWENVSEETKSFIKGLMEKNPTKRLTADQALDHPWLKA